MIKLIKVNGRLLTLNKYTSMIIFTENLTSQRDFVYLEAIVDINDISIISITT